MRIYRKYIDEGEFKIVEAPKTDGNGETIAHLVVNDVIYRFAIMKGGVVLATIDNVRAFCYNPTITECKIELNTFATGIDVESYEQGEDLNFTLGYNKTSREVTSQFIIPSGTSSTVSLEVIKEDQLGTTVCTDTETGISGTLSCTIPESFGNATVLAKLYKDGDLQAQGQIKVDQEPSDIYGGVVAFIGIIALMVLVGVGVSDNPVLTTIFIIVGIILMYSLNIVSNSGFVGATATVLWLLVALVIVLIKGVKRN